MHCIGTASEQARRIGLWVVGIVMMAWCIGCQIQSGVTPCGDQLCPVGDRCFAGQCAKPAAVDACTDAAENAQCTFDSKNGTCVGGVCTLQVCGNEVIEPGEVCDDGNQRDGDGCAGNCRSTETCGNGILDINEGCDCGATVADKSERCVAVNSNGPQQRMHHAMQTAHLWRWC
jgi:cysteine-rich repeat protein